jgi:hypothetical protein
MLMARSGHISVTSLASGILARCTTLYLRRWPDYTYLVATRDTARPIPDSLGLRGDATGQHAEPAGPYSGDVLTGPLPFRAWSALAGGPLSDSLSPLDAARPAVP